MPLPAKDFFELEAFLKLQTPQTLPIPSPIAFSPYCFPSLARIRIHICIRPRTVFSFVSICFYHVVWSESWRTSLKKPAQPRFLACRADIQMTRHSLLAGCLRWSQMILTMLFWDSPHIWFLTAPQPSRTAISKPGIRESLSRAVQLCSIQVHVDSSVVLKIKRIDGREGSESAWRKRLLWVSPSPLPSRSAHNRDRRLAKRRKPSIKPEGHLPTHAAQILDPNTYSHTYTWVTFTLGVPDKNIPRLDRSLNF